MVNYKQMGERISSQRKKQKLTQEQLSERAGITPTNLSHIERGKTKASIETIVALANALGVTVNDFLVDSLDFSTTELQNILSELLLDCTTEELRLISDVAYTIKLRLRT